VASPDKGLRRVITRVSIKQEEGPALTNKVHSTLKKERDSLRKKPVHYEQTELYAIRVFSSGRGGELLVQETVAKGGRASVQSSPTQRITRFIWRIRPQEEKGREKTLSSSNAVTSSCEAGGGWLSEMVGGVPREKRVIFLGSLNELSLQKRGEKNES